MVPKLILLENKVEVEEKKDPLALANLVWKNKHIAGFDYRVLLVYSENEYKQNKAIYVKTQEEAKKLQNFFGFQTLLEGNYNFSQKISNFSIFYKTLASNTFHQFLATYVKKHHLDRVLSRIGAPDLKEERKKEEIKEKEIEKQKQKQKNEKLLMDLWILQSETVKNSLNDLLFSWLSISNVLKKRKEIENERTQIVLQEVTQNSWLLNLNNLIIYEKFFKKWLMKAVNNMNEERKNPENCEFHLNFIEIETPIVNWMDLFKPIIMVSGHIDLDKVASRASPSNSNLKSLFLKKSDILKKKKYFFIQFL